MKGKSVSQDVLERRRNRFAEKSEPRVTDSRISEPRRSDEPIVGRCTRLEKAYFRLTTVPNPDEIRPEPVLKEAYKRLKSMWKAGGDLKYGRTSSSIASYIMDQMKAIRQDLVVQKIQDPFSVKVYETHAKISLDKSDLNEFNQVVSLLCLRSSVNRCSLPFTRPSLPSTSSSSSPISSFTMLPWSS